MNTFWKVFLGFLGGVVFTIGAICIIGVVKQKSQTPDESDKKNNTVSIKEREEDFIKEYQDNIKRSNIQYFELTTKDGYVKLHTYMHKDSVKLIMGKPNTVDILNLGALGTKEIWYYKGRNHYIDEFVITFHNGELESLNQHQE